MKDNVKNAWRNILSFTEKQSFPIMIVICVAVITATALYTRQSNTGYVSPTPPVVEHISAAQLIQQSVHHAATPSPQPTEAPLAFICPLADSTILRPFDLSTMYLFDSGIQKVHDGADLSAEPGDAVRAMADGEVTGSGSDALHGSWIRIQHPGNIQVFYAGMTMMNDYIPGDSVRKGDIIGFCGNEYLEEKTLGPHLHLQAVQHGKSIDPVRLWSENE